MFYLLFSNFSNRCYYNRYILLSSSAASKQHTTLAQIKSWLLPWSQYWGDSREGWGPLHLNKATTTQVLPIIMRQYTGSMLPDLSIFLKNQESESFCETSQFLCMFSFSVEDHFLKVFIEFVTSLLLFHVLSFLLQGMWDLSCLTRDWTYTHCIWRWSLNHWTTKEVPKYLLAFPGDSDGKESCDAGDTSSVPGLGRSPEGGHGNSLQYSCLENPMDRGAEWTSVHGVTNRTWLSNPNFHFHIVKAILQNQIWQISN